MLMLCRAQDGESIKSMPQHTTRNHASMALNSIAVAIKFHLVLLLFQRELDMLLIRLLSFTRL
jgi:hypothetical protein